MNTPHSEKRLRLNPHPDTEQQELERHRQFLALSDQERMSKTFELIRISLEMGGRPKQPQGLGLIIKKK